jgi:hypothetical protein
MVARRTVEAALTAERVYIAARREAIRAHIAFDIQLESIYGVAAEGMQVQLRKELPEKLPSEFMHLINAQPAVPDALRESIIAHFNQFYSADTHFFEVDRAYTDALFSELEGEVLEQLHAQQQLDVRVS